MSAVRLTIRSQAPKPTDELMWGVGSAFGLDAVLKVGKPQRIEWQMVSRIQPRRYLNWARNEE